MITLHRIAQLREPPGPSSVSMDPTEREQLLRLAEAALRLYEGKLNQRDFVKLMNPARWPTQNES